MKKIILLMCLLVIGSYGAIAQQSTNHLNSKQRCGFNQVNSPEALMRFEAGFAPKLANYLKTGKKNKTVFTIPTVAHVIHNSNEVVGSGRTAYF